MQPDRLHASTLDLTLSKENVMNEAQQLEVVELGDAKFETKGMQMAPLPEENPAVQRRQPL